MVLILLYPKQQEIFTLMDMYLNHINSSFNLFLVFHYFCTTNCTRSNYYSLFIEMKCGTMNIYYFIPSVTWRIARAAVILEVRAMLIKLLTKL